MFLSTFNIQHSTLTIRLLSGAIALLLSCSADRVTPAEWQGMTSSEKVLYVNSLIGAEKAKEAKGGGGRDYPRPAVEYAAAIDAAYARGDGRDAQQIFEGLEPAR